MLTPGRLGRYEVRGLLGKGAMGTVFDAWDPELSRGVAIKVIQAAHLDVEGLERFKREARTLARLSHPHIVAIHDIGTAEDGAPYIVMERVDGDTLAAEINRRVDRPLSEKVRLAAQVCDALDLASREGIVHRDVKPGNILITVDNQAKLSDFGLARLQDSSLTGTSNVVGTPAYLPPEAFSGEALDARADVYGVAASLFEWVCGARPHEAEHLATLMAHIIHHEAPDVRDKSPACPSTLADCLRRGLARNRSERYQSAREFANDLRAFESSNEAVAAGAAATVILDHGPVAGPVRRPGRQRVLVAALVTVSILIAAVLVSQTATAPGSGAANPPVNATVPSPAGDAPPAVVAPEPETRVARRVTPPPTPKSIAEPAPTLLTEEVEDIELPPAVPIGTRVMVAIVSELRTDRATRGQSFEAVLVDPLIWNGREVAAVDARVQGIVDAVVPGTGANLPSLQLSLSTIQIGGEPTRVRTARYEVVAPAINGEPRALTLIIGAVAGAAIGGVVGGSKGAASGAAIGAAALGRPVSPKNGEYVFGNRLTFKLAEPLRLQPGTQ